ncbi:hypothetical protein OPV22_001876 [Ensete ventricosum]|uniref:Bulb-type lectin domain-containing protein n=1 Tax=Ensete ventricosum TaxID=4639 RepID=A0A426YIE8_ENSVE|nr:hypothetical protein OPV22_001876 [Ensete ventricosum]RRT51447.1 hypothetical protein B296_00045460 [Ensete ventricosum]RWW38478.1 hypothetical protein BHE74_00056284 [Ensete ventricosum]RZS20028.1 hypothetical protein BHM03_00052499 [Ensete ventricosum]
MASAAASVSVASLILPVLLGLLLLPPPCAADNILYSGESLNSGQSLRYGSYNFIMQSDCNLVLYDNNRAVWASGTNGRGSNCVCRMQTDGNLVVYTGSTAVWASNTDRGRGNYVCILQRDHNVVVYGGALWATGTNIGSARVIIAGNSNTTAAPAVVATAPKNK